MKKARSLQPDYPGLTDKLALLCDRLLQDHKAQVEYLRALQQQPDNPARLNDFGYFHYLRGRYAEAERYFRQAIAVCERSSPVRSSSRTTDASASKSSDAALGQRVYVNLGLALAQQGKLQDSYAAFTKVLSPAQAHYNMAVVLLQRAGHLPEQQVAEQQRLRQLARQHLHLALQHDASLRLARNLLETLDNPKPASDQSLAANTSARGEATPAPNHPRFSAPNDKQSADSPPPVQRETSQPVQPSTNNAVSSAPSGERFPLVIPPPPVPQPSPTTSTTELIDHRRRRGGESAPPPTSTTGEPQRSQRPLRRPLRDDLDSP